MMERCNAHSSLASPVEKEEVCDPTVDGRCEADKKGALTPVPSSIGGRKLLQCRLSPVSPPAHGIHHHWDEGLVGGQDVAVGVPLDVLICCGRASRGR